MAKCKAHGHEIGTVYFESTAKRYMSDGVILKNNGFGWKLHGKVKPELTPQQAYQAQVEKQKTLLASRPALAAYRTMLHNMAGLSKRWKLRSALQLLGDDVDGIWSECCDGYSDNISADVDEIAELVRAYKVALMEQTDVRRETAHLKSA